ncbi:MAG: molybdopterin-binding protein [Thiovulaceae bacterium]|nr:molybdopterin-binding protein [Sulfurimonadaceae bacterium]
MDTPNFYLVIIGTEILNGRRDDAHFDFVKKILLEHHVTLFATFIIEDDTQLISQIFEMIKNDPCSVLFSFGGIGSTPDDLTRQIAADTFTRKPLQQHTKFAQDIKERFGDAAFPNRINMAMLPQKSKLLFNPVNNMSGFQLFDRYFFVPGFPEMSHPMITDVVHTFFANFSKKHRLTLTAQCSEDRLISLMKQLPQELSLSSLPQFVDNRPNVVLSLASKDEKVLKHYFQTFIDYLITQNIDYFLGES